MSRNIEIGRVYDAATGATGSEPVAFDPDRLVTHGVVFGMTGSGKTGLSIGLLESLVEANVPLLILDPKGDLPNLALLFPDLDPASFEPWVDAQEAEREGISVAQLAQDTASAWQNGLAGWGIGPERVKALSEKMDLSIYTPGSDSGIPVNVLGAFQRPDDAVMSDLTARRDLVQGTVSGLLGLVGRDADPVRSPDHIVLSRILDDAWEAGENLELESLILRLVDPPFKKVGVFPLDAFFKPDDRMDLAMELNGVLASPSFAPWTTGQSLDLAEMTTVKNNKVPVSIFYLAHLSDSERMFFTALFLERVVAWSRTLSGTSSLRALVYFDEVMGYLPPYPKNPPSKRPILTLLKQARGVGVGVVLATQNPVDIDYKAISNAGSWFIGRLQTKQDRERVTDGLLSAAGGMDRAALDRALDGLKKRVFLVKDPSKDAPTLFSTRWVMSFLRGPMTRVELEKLEASRFIATDGPTE